MPYLVVSDDEPRVTFAKKLDDELLEEAINGDVIVIQFNPKKGAFEALDAETGIFSLVEERDE